MKEEIIKKAVDKMAEKEEDKSHPFGYNDNSDLHEEARAALEDVSWEEGLNMDEVTEEDVKEVARRFRENS